MRDKFAIGILLFLSCVLIASCDTGKKPYEEAEALFNQSKYSAAKSKAEEVIKNAPKSKYVPMAKEMVEKINISNDAMNYFRIFEVSRYPQASIVFTKYVAQRNKLFRLPGGRELMELRLKAYLVEVENALDNLASLVEKVEKGKGKTQIVHAEKYNAALSDFTANYGRPEGWIRGICRKSGADTLRKCRIKLLTEKKIDVWMEPNSPSEYADWLSRKMSDYN
ncbi:MAG: hypothetical protein AABY39_11775 [Nitrospirota bacterium]